MDIVLLLPLWLTATPFLLATLWDNMECALPWANRIRCGDEPMPGLLLTNAQPIALSVGALWSIAVLSWTVLASEACWRGHRVMSFFLLLGLLFGSGLAIFMSVGILGSTDGLTQGMWIFVAWMVSITLPPLWVAIRHLPRVLRATFGWKPA